MDSHFCRYTTNDTDSSTGIVIYPWLQNHVLKYVGHCCCSFACCSAYSV